MQSVGSRVQTYSHRYLSDGASDNLFQDIRNGLFTSVWLTMPSRRAAGRHEHPIVNKMAGLGRIASANGIFTVICGSEGRIPGKSQSLQPLITGKNLTLTKHSYCAYDAKLPGVTPRPIGWGQVILCSHWTENVECTCGDTQEHYNIREHHTGIARMEYEQILHRKLYTNFIGKASECSNVARRRSAMVDQDVMSNRPLTSRPDSGIALITHQRPTDDDTTTLTADPIPAFPTTAKERQKARLKANKELGIKPKKKPKIVEAGSDDLGEDLSGIDMYTSTTDGFLESSDSCYSESEDSDDEMTQGLDMPLPRISTTKNHARCPLHSRLRCADKDARRCRAWS